MFLSWFSAALLRMIGWKSRMHYATRQLLETADGDLVLLFQHTSYCDLLFGLLFAWSEGIGHRLYFITGSHVRSTYWWLTPILRAVGCVYVPQLHESAQGTVSKLVEIFRDDPTPRKIILVAPTGSTKNTYDRPWRSGWYWLARELGAKVGVIGVNFHPLIRTIHLGQEHIVQQSFLDPERLSFDQMCLRCKVLMGNIFPRWPHESPVPLKTPYKLFGHECKYHTTPNHVITFVDMVVVTSYLFIIPILRLMQVRCLDLVVVGIPSMIASVKYHQSYEQDHYWHTMDVKLAIASVMYFAIRILCTVQPTVYFLWFSSLMACIQVYYAGTPRGASIYRSKWYELYHSLFHVLLSLYILAYANQLMVNS